MVNLPFFPQEQNPDDERKKLLPKSDEERQEAAEEFWQRLAEGLLEKYASIDGILLTVAFHRQINLLLSVCLRVAKMNGSWPFVMALIVEARSVGDVVWAGLWLWSQCMPEDLDHLWSPPEQERWITFAHEFLHKIEYVDIKLDAAMKELNKFTKAMYVVAGADGEATGNGVPGGSKYPAAAKRAVVTCARTKTAAKVKAADYIFAPFKVEQRAKLAAPEDPSANVSDLEKLGKTAGILAACYPIVGNSATACNVAMQGIIPRDKCGDEARNIAMGAGLAASTVVWTGAAVAVASGALLTAPAAVVGVGAFMFEFAPALSVACMGPMSYAAIKTYRRTVGIKQDSKREARDFHSAWREEWVAALSASRIALGKWYAAAGAKAKVVAANGAPGVHFEVVSQSGIRLLNWNNLGVGQDLDIIEAMVWQDASIAKDHVRFEFTALKHIWWDKKLEIITRRDERISLQITKDKRRATSRPLRMKKEWPLQLAFFKGTFPGVFGEVGKPWPCPGYPGICGCTVRFIWVAAKPNNC